MALRPAPPLAPPAGLDWCRAAFAYEGVGRELIARLKYRNARSALPWLATVLAALAPVEVDVITWVPTSRPRRRARGFDQSELLARAVARHLQRPCRRLLHRGGGPPQTGHDAASRRVGPPLSIRRWPPPHVMLVDDVVTTGATLAVAAAVLKRAGAARVSAVAAARTPLSCPKTSPEYPTTMCWSECADACSAPGGDVWRSP